MGTVAGSAGAAPAVDIAGRVIGDAAHLGQSFGGELVDEVPLGDLRDPDLGELEKPVCPLDDDGQQDCPGGRIGVFSHAFDKLARESN